MKATQIAAFPVFACGLILLGRDLYFRAQTRRISKFIPVEAVLRSFTETNTTFEGNSGKSDSFYLRYCYEMSSVVYWRTLQVDQALFLSRYRQPEEGMSLPIMVNPNSLGESAIPSIEFHIRRGKLSSSCFVVLMGLVLLVV